MEEVKDALEVHKNESRRYFVPKVVQHLPKNPSVQKNFTNTLGLKTDGLITELFKRIKSEIVGKNVCENQGKGVPQHKISMEIREKITSHINNFKPCAPHYQRKNIPNLKYLPSSLTIHFIFDDFVKRIQMLLSQSKRTGKFLKP